MIPFSIHLCGTFGDFAKIINEFDSVLEALSSKIEHENAEDLKPGSSLIPAGSSRFVGSDKGTLVGLDEELVQFKDKLTGSPSELRVISVVGMGGIGKTTLARNLYSDSLIEHHFDIRSWVVVCEGYDVHEMLTGLLCSTTDYVSCGLIRESIEQLGVQVYKSLKGRRYLVVMDDVWDTKVWDDVRRFLPDDNNGSRIILTTRLSEVAIYTKSYGSIHHMSLLSLEVSWILLREKVFGKEYCCASEWEEIGKKIAKNCNGLPLAIAVIGGLLSKASRSMDYWEYIAENVKSTIIENDDQIMEILSLSYNSLPHHLKACFLYMGVFPENYVIYVSQLIKLWIAEGFIKSVAFKSIEEVADDYLKDLIDRSLVQVLNINHNGRVKTCIIHDLLREMCAKRALDEKCLHIIDKDVHFLPTEKSKQRRVSIQSNTLNRLILDVHESSIRSLLYFTKGITNDNISSFTMWSTRLRVFDALTIKFYEFPVEIVELVHLRYLAFIYKGINKIPESISKLQNLQTLIIFAGQFTSFEDTFYLPLTIWDMPQLRHLLLERSFFPCPSPARIIRIGGVVLANLQTLSEVTNFKFTKGVVKIMAPNLKKLGISYFDDTETEWSSYRLNNLIYLHQLETLKCSFFTNQRLHSPINLALPRSLKKLTLSGSRISWDKMTIVGSLPNLEVLKLKDEAFEGSTWKLNEGEFRKLKFFLIHVNFLEQWRVTNTHFPQLQHLSFSYCTNLQKIPSEIGDILTLEMIELYECKAIAVASAMLIQEEQESLGNDSLTVRVKSFNDYYASLSNSSLRRAQRAPSDRKKFAFLKSRRCHR